MIFLEIVTGFLLSLAELEGLRRSANRLMGLQVLGKGWMWLFALRYGALAMVFWAFLELFKSSIFPFVCSFILSHLLLRFFWYRRSVHV